MHSDTSIDLYHILQVDPTAHPRVVQAAYRALATIHHPDQTRTGSHDEMARINRAYGILRDPAKRLAHDQRRDTSAATPLPDPPVVTPPPAPLRVPPTTSGIGSTLPYGRYAGWTLDQLVRTDPDYLRWLSRHTSGLRYRSEIQRLLAAPPARQVAARR